MASPRQWARYREGVGYSALGYLGVAATAALACFATEAGFFELHTIEHFTGQLPDSLNLPAAGMSSILAVIVGYKTKTAFDSATTAFAFSKLKEIRPQRFPPVPMG